MLQKLDTDKITNTNRMIYHSKWFNSRGTFSIHGCFGIINNNDVYEYKSEFLATDRVW